MGDHAPARALSRAVVVLGAFLVILLDAHPYAMAGDETRIPALSLWEQHMVLYGRRHCEALAKPGLTFDEQLGATYYDAIRVMYQIAEYTRQPFWNACARRAREIYRDRYVLAHGGAVPGYWNFTMGLRMDYQRTASPESRAAVVALSQRAAFAADTTPQAWTRGFDRSREVAYALLSYIDAEALGEPRRTRRALLVDQAYDHMDQWFMRFEWQGATMQFSPFMVALTAHSLIRDWEQTKDPRLVPALTRAADWLWRNAWIPSERAMWYEHGHTTGAPDLNLLIAPMYAFLYRQTGDLTYREEGDRLFAGGVQHAYLEGPKQFNQNYWWSFDYVRWRRGSDSPIQRRPE